MDKAVKASKGLEGLTPWTWSQGGNIPGNHYGPATKVGALIDEEPVFVCLVVSK